MYLSKKCALKKVGGPTPSNILGWKKVHLGFP